MRKILLLTALLFAIAGVGQAQTIEPSLLQKPTLSRTHVVFAYAGDLWIVGREGGTASRLTTGAGVETDPKFEYWTTRRQVHVGRARRNLRLSAVD